MKFRIEMSQEEVVIAIRNYACSELGMRNLRAGNVVLKPGFTAVVTSHPGDETEGIHDGEEIK